MSPRLLYTSFDEVPGPKGASTHIEAFTRALGEYYGDVVLVTPGPQDVALREVFPKVRQLVLGTPGENPIARARVFRTKLREILEKQVFDLIHFRSIFEGLPLTDWQLARDAALIYEANGFPSIELKYHYRKVAANDSLIERLANQEKACLDAAHRVLTISDVTATHIASQGVPDQKISVIRNGVDPQAFSFQSPPDASAAGVLQLCYVGTLTGWQGIETLIEATELVRKQRSVRLTIMGPQPKYRRQQLDKLIRRLRLDDNVVFKPSGSKEEVCELLHQSHFCIVPLLAVDRNCVQGCCPLKLIEAMAAGAPVIASDLPIVQELAEPNKHFAPVRAGDAKNLRNVILELADNRDLVLRQTEAAQELAKSMTWHNATQKLIDVYNQLLPA
ncbi:MAG: glycosyltransferase family 4 protein [Planctomycetaceae bacterium]